MRLCRPSTCEPMKESASLTIEQNLPADYPYWYSYAPSLRLLFHTARPDLQVMAHSRGSWRFRDVGEVDRHGRAAPHARLLVTWPQIDGDESTLGRWLGDDALTSVVSHVLDVVRLTSSDPDCDNELLIERDSNDPTSQACVPTAAMRRLGSSHVRIVFKYNFVRSPA